MKAPIAWAVAAWSLGGAAFAFSDSTTPARAADGAIAAAQGLVAQVAQSLEGAEPARTLSSPQSAVDEVIEARLPHAERTPYEPLKKSLDDLLEEGWELDQASGSLDGFTLLISNGGLRALCVLVPSELGQQDEALVDCRRLN